MPDLRSWSWKSLVFLAVGLVFLGWLLNTPEGILGKADAIGYAVCHRIDARSFHLGDRQLPLCARCSGMYLGAMVGLVFQAGSGRRRGGMPPLKIIAVFALLVVFFGVDGLNSYLNLFNGAPSLYEPNNVLRLITGTGMGLAMAAAIYPAFNQTVWKNWNPKPALGSWQALLGLFALAGVSVLLVLTDNPVVLYPLALLSAATVLAILTMVYAMVWIMLFRLENRYQKLAHLIMPLTGGFGLAILQIAVLDFIRFLLTGTWDGFHFG